MDPTEMRDRMQRAEREARNLLALATITYNDLRGAVTTLRDLPPDTVLGGNGTAALDEIVGATDGLGAVLANYPDRKAAMGELETERECRRRWARKVLDHKRRIAELERERDEAKEDARFGAEFGDAEIRRREKAEMEREQEATDG